MALLALTGITGIYVRNVTAMGVLGLVGYLIYAAFWLLVIGYAFIEVFVQPQLAEQAPQFVSDSLALFAGGTIEGDLGPLQALNPIAAVAYLFGGLLFGVAVYRARILARWASLLLPVGTLAALAVPLVPHSMARIAAIPVGVALVGLGYSLMREHRAVPAVRDAQFELAGAR